MKDINQNQIEILTNKARKILEGNNLDFFIVAGNKSFGALHTASTNNNSAASNARRAHVKWEKKRGIDSEHARDKSIVKQATDIFDNTRAPLLTHQNNTKSAIEESKMARAKGDSPVAIRHKNVAAKNGLVNRITKTASCNIRGKYL